MTNSVQLRTLELFPNLYEQIVEKFDCKKIEMYFQFLKDYNEIGGFFSKSDSQNILDRHIIESIFHIFKIISVYPVTFETKLADIGSGPGLPGYLFFTLKTPPIITLIDSQRRRLGLLEKFHHDQFKDSNVTFVYERVEDIKIKFDLVIMRSTIKYPWSVEMLTPLLKMNSTFIPFLGKKNYDFEFEKKLLKNLGIKIEKELDLDELEFLGKRHIKLLKKTGECNNGFPRKWETINKEIKRTSWEK